jgi:hypothetical protein
MKKTTSSAIRVSITPEVGRALKRAKRIYPTLSDPEILKLGLAKIASEDRELARDRELEDVRRGASYSVGYDYLGDPEEDVYTEGMGEKVDFK